jgi:hypothetical protein
VWRLQRLSGFELVDLPPTLLEPLIEGIARTRELLKRLPGIISLPKDRCHLPLGQALEPHLLPTYAQTAPRRFVVATTRSPDLLEDGPGLLALAGLDKLGEAIDRHGSTSLCLGPQ